MQALRVDIRNDIAFDGVAVHVAPSCARSAFASVRFTFTVSSPGTAETITTSTRRQTRRRVPAHQPSATGRTAHLAHLWRLRVSKPYRLQVPPSISGGWHQR